jgi:hypothetical protein
VLVKLFFMKSILVFSSVLFISIAAIFQTNNVVITSTLPNYAKPGETVDFNITVSKGSLGGFSKLQMVFPAGFEIEASDVKGGTFSFVDQKLKIIWLSLPADPKFNVSFKVKIKLGTKGSFPLEGQFSYIQDGVRTDAIYKTNIFIAEDKPAAVAKAEAKAEAEKASSEPVESTAVASTDPAVSTVNFEFIRSIANLKLKPSESTTVKLDVLKKGISGFGKITEIIPEGFTAEEIESNGAIFSVLSNEVRFLWMTLPASDSFEVSYKLVASDTEGERSIKGSFSYVEDTKTRLNSTSATIFSVTKVEDVIASGAPESTTTTETPAVNKEDTISQTSTTTTASAEETTPPENSTEATATNEGSTSPATEETATSELASTNSLTEETVEATSSTETASSTGDVSYRVQICATRKAVDKQHFVTNNAVNETIYADMHDGWHKFTVGAFGVYGEARNHREDVKESNKITGPFVTAYNAGDRITVQEALMISKQQWIP